MTFHGNVILDWIPSFWPEVNRPLDDAGMTRDSGMTKDLGMTR